LYPADIVYASYTHFENPVRFTQKKRIYTNAPSRKESEGFGHLVGAKGRFVASSRDILSEGPQGF
jgi:hypothetical protein